MSASIKGIAAGLLVAAVATASFSASAQEVGRMTLEKSQVSRGGVRVGEGSGISLGDQLVANATGAGVIVFEDESTARMGPNAVLTIDEFVYDPGRRSGTVRLGQTSGLSRIYGGQISKRGRAEIRTPHIVLVVRGGVVDLKVESDKTYGTLRGGIMKCEVGGKTRTVTNPGMTCIADGNTLDIRRLTNNNGHMVTPSGPGGGDAGRGYDEAHCASASASEACGSDNGSLPRLGFGNGGNDPLSGGPSGGSVECYLIEGPYCPDFEEDIGGYIGPTY
ncbi:FecR domain-containing protein [Oricola sp.]|uniref:FecR domain-containing protein n=1 Tax=Oricola sp. TaxID=1979950 RepID=UPI0025CC231C|nr:FecR domain-containing protein [Oricola sp.]MCI5074289.1 FecR domain-containing protein [Oricola sp.]